MPIDTDPALSALIVSFAVSLLIVLTQCWHGHLSHDLHSGVQRQHLAATPRVGGIALWSGLSAGYLMCQDEHQLCGTVIAVGTPAFMVGLWEDVTKSVSVRMRLAITMVGGLIGWSFTGYSLDHLHTPFLDDLLAFPLVSIALTCFAIAGVANAINIIDGFNGLASGTVVVSASAFFLLAQQAGDAELMMACGILIAAVAGFIVINWPGGKLFLGDGGAYLAGTALGWLAVMFNARIPEISAWAMLLICAYPIQEVLFSIWRRRSRKMHWGDPDRLHLHSLVGRRVVNPCMPWASRTTRNSVTGLVMLLASALPAAWALMWPNDHPMLMAGFLTYIMGYRLIYARLVRFAWIRQPQPLARGHWRRT